MACQQCKSEHVLHISAKCADNFLATFDDKVSIVPDNVNGWGYVPIYLGIGGHKHLHFSYCLDCGRIQGTFPKVIDDKMKEKEQLFWELVGKITMADVEKVLDVARKTKYFEEELGLDFNPDTNNPVCYVMAHDEIMDDLKIQIFDGYYADFHEATVDAAIFHTACIFGADPATWKN